MEYSNSATSVRCSMGFPLSRCIPYAVLLYQPYARFQNAGIAWILSSGRQFQEKRIAPGAQSGSSRRAGLERHDHGRDIVLSFQKDFLSKIRPAFRYQSGILQADGDPAFLYVLQEPESIFHCIGSFQPAMRHLHAAQNTHINSSEPFLAQAHLHG